MVARLTPDQKVASSILVRPSSKTAARLAQSVERKTLNLVVVGSSPTVGIKWFSGHMIFGGEVWRCEKRSRQTPIVLTITGILH